MTRRTTPLRIVLADLCYSNKFTASVRYTPLNIGYVGQYVIQKAGTDVALRLHKDFDALCQDIAAVKPDVIAFSLSYWNTDLGRHAARYARSLYGSNVCIVYGGPSIDTDPREQCRLFSALPDADYLVTDEGELGFWNIVSKILSSRTSPKQQLIDGAVFWADGSIQAGKPVGLTLDLSTLASPYTSGLLDPFLTNEFQPLLQTSRLCPYTCAFCVSGKTRGKLRAFPIDQVKEEISYIARAYKGRDHQTLYIADENFGILARDTEIAESIRSCGENIGYPKAIFFYNDKRFTDTSKTVVETLADINAQGLCLALQTENKEALKAIHRSNLNETEIISAITWAKQRNLLTTTELIFGLPFETRDSFIALLNRSVSRGFDTVLCHNLFIMDGIELNRSGVREKFGIKTAFRLLGASYGYFNDNFILEHEEVVVATNSFSEQDFLTVRGQNLMFYTVFALNFYKPFFQLLRVLGCGLADVFELFLSGAGGDDPHYKCFLSEFNSAVTEELFDSRDALVNHVREQYNSNGRNAIEPSRINVLFGARLIYMETAWVRAALEHILSTRFNSLFTGNEAMIRNVLDLAERERVNIHTCKLPAPLIVNYDFLNWERGKYEGVPNQFDSPTNVYFEISENAIGQINSFMKEFDQEDLLSLNYLAMNFITPRHLLLHQKHYCNSLIDVLPMP